LQKVRVIEFALPSAQVRGLEGAKFQRWLYVLDYHGSQNFAPDRFPRLSFHPTGAYRLFGPNDHNTGRTVQSTLDGLVELLAGKDIVIPPDFTAAKFPQQFTKP
jgi:hypothetical protein